MCLAEMDIAHLTLQWASCSSVRIATISCSPGLGRVPGRIGGRWGEGGVGRDGGGGGQRCLSVYNISCSTCRIATALGQDTL